MKKLIAIVLLVLSVFNVQAGDFYFNTQTTKSQKETVTNCMRKDFGFNEGMDEALENSDLMLIGIYFVNGTYTMRVSNNRYGKWMETRPLYCDLRSEKVKAQEKAIVEARRKEAEIIEIARQEKIAYVKAKKIEDNKLRAIKKKKADEARAISKAKNDAIQAEKDRIKAIKKAETDKAEAIAKAKKNALRASEIKKHVDKVIAVAESCLKSKGRNLTFTEVDIVQKEITIRGLESDRKSFEKCGLSKSHRTGTHIKKLNGKFELTNLFGTQIY